MRDLIVITGCNSGLGYSLAMHCRAQGATVLAGVRKISEAKIAKTTAIEALENKGVIVRQLDITDETSVRQFGEGVKKLLKERQLGKCKDGSSQNSGQRSERKWHSRRPCFIFQTNLILSLLNYS